jgi:hypothetical protein
MMHKALLVVAASIVLCALAKPGHAFPAASIHASQGRQNLQQISFWGEAFPYGYNWSVVRACTGYEPVETTQGTRMQRVWVCAEKWRDYRQSHPGALNGLY